MRAQSFTLGAMRGAIRGSVRLMARGFSTRVAAIGGARIGVIQK